MIRRWLRRAQRFTRRVVVGRGWVVVGSARSVHSWKRTLVLPGRRPDGTLDLHACEVFKCPQCGALAVLGGVSSSAASFLQIKPSDLGLSDRERYIWTDGEPPECYALSVAPAAEAAE
ncbi:MAG: hypothetical protein JWM74_5703 [Myxococcaceae bacterium]|nr:hypothetical protein [Myxococcaceae bacterium]